MNASTLAEWRRKVEKIHGNSCLGGPLLITQQLVDLHLGEADEKGMPEVAHKLVRAGALAFRYTCHTYGTIEGNDVAVLVPPATYFQAVPKKETMPYTLEIDWNAPVPELERIK